MHDLDVRNVPSEVLDRARSCLVDALACAGAGAQMTHMQHLVAALSDLDGGAGPGRIWFVPGQCSLSTEAFANGSLIHAWDYDDSHKGSKTHPGAAVIPAALAAGRRVKADLADVFAGIIVGYEVSMRLGSGVGVAAHRQGGWHATSTCGAVGAAAAAARTLRLDASHVASAIGNGTSQAAGIWAFTNDGAMSKKFHPGHAARAGLTAAVLAQAGISGSRVALEGPDGGFFQAFAPQQPVAHWTEVLDAIGEPFWLPDVALKPYPCCRTAHTAIDAVLALRNDGLRIEDVGEVTVYTYGLAVEQCGFNDPCNEVQAAFSTPYLVACALRDGWIDIDHFTPEQIADQSLRDLQRRVRVVHDRALDAQFPEMWPSRVVVRTKDGESKERQVDVALGDPAVPMSGAEQGHKLRAGIEPALGAERATALAESVWGLPLSGASVPLWEALEATGGPTPPASHNSTLP